MAFLLPTLIGGNLFVLETVFYISKPLLVRADIVTVAVEYPGKIRTQDQPQL